MSNKPGKAELEWFYTVEGLSTHRIGAMYQRPHITICRWMKRFGIVRRPTGCGLKNRGLAEPTREQLYALVHLQHKTYDEIAAVFGVGRSAIKFWLDKYGIDRPGLWGSRHKGRRLPTDEELRSLYVERGQSTAQIADLFGISSGAIQDRCRKAGIQLRRDGFNGGSRFQCADGHLVRSTYEQRVCNWLHERGIAHEYEPQLPFSSRYHADFFAAGCFIEIWGIVGNPVYKQRVGYKRSLYRAHGMPLIELPVHAFDSQRKGMWERRLLPLTLSSVPESELPSQVLYVQYPLPW